MKFGKRMKKEHWIMISLLLILWEVAAVSVGNDILVPYPFEVVKKVGILCSTSRFYTTILNTVLRVLKGFMYSMVAAIIPAILADNNESFAQFFKPLQVILKTIPNVSYMILALIWLGAEGAVSAVSFMILFPVFFNSFMNALLQHKQEYGDVDTLYPETFFHKTMVRTLPLLVNEILYTGKTCASLGLKVGVMAEILGQVRIGIGKQLFLSKINLDTTSLLAWTLVIIGLSICFDRIFDALIAYRVKEEQH